MVVVQVGGGVVGLSETKGLAQAEKPTGWLCTEVNAPPTLKGGGEVHQAAVSVFSDSPE